MYRHRKTDHHLLQPKLLPRQNVAGRSITRVKINTGMFPERAVASFIVPLTSVTSASGSVIVLLALKLAGEAMVTLLVLSLSNSFKVPVPFTLSSAIIESLYLQDNYT